MSYDDMPQKQARIEALREENGQVTESETDDCFLMKQMQRVER